MQTKYLELLNNCENELTFLARLKGFPKKEIDSLFESLSPIRINKGAYLYRIRKNILPTEKAPWGIYKNNKRFGRFDKNNSILYVAESDCFLEQETYLNINDEYCLGKYVVITDFVVGCPFFPNNNFENISFCLHKICQAINEKHLSQEDIDKLSNIKSSYLSKPVINSLKTGIEFGDKIYEHTNWIGERIINVFKNGIAYSSSFNPIDTFIGNCRIVLDDDIFNIALTESGYKNIKFIDCQKKIAKRNTNFSILIDTQLSEFKKEELSNENNKNGN